jgi:hypothetical protein
MLLAVFPRAFEKRTQKTHAQKMSAGAARPLGANRRRPAAPGAGRGERSALGGFARNPA